MMEPNRSDWTKCQLLYSEVIQKIDTHFEQLAIPYMPIKGAYLICSGLAEKMPYRRMCDIDILVKPETMKQVSDYFFNCNGFEPRTHYTKNTRPYETSFYYELDNAKVLVEIHSLLNFPERFALQTQDLFKRSVIKRGMLVLSSPEDALLIFLCHLFTHFPFEWRETNYEELDLLTSHSDFSWDKFNVLAQKTGIGSFIHYILKCFAREKVRNLPIGKSTLYSSALFHFADVKNAVKWPRLIKRLLFELPFVKNPAFLITNKVRNHY